jgi:hypothetical protein
VSWPGPVRPASATTTRVSASDTARDGPGEPARPLYVRLTLRYERSARLFTAFLTLAAALTCYKKLTT